jgi:aminoglycoside phosphotransferase (APT) family kinase protein
VRRLAQRLDDQLADLPRGFGHGDFFRGNMLVDHDRLVGVVDWDAAGPASLPLVDLLHLRHMSKHRPADRDFGPTLVSDLLPWGRAGGDELSRAYCRRIGIKLGEGQLEAIVLAYWLDRISYQLRTYADRSERPVLMERNVNFVLRAAVATWL